MKKGHISIDLVIRMFSPRVRAIIDTATNFLSLAIFVLVTRQTIKYAQLLHASNDVSAVLRLPEYPFLIVAAIGCFMFCLAMLCSFLQSLVKAIIKMSPILVGFLGVVLLQILFALRMQVGMSMLIVGFRGFAYISKTSASLTLLGMVPYATSGAYGLSVIPLFILMGMFLSYGGLGKDIFDAANTWVRHRKGGMAMATIAATAVWSAISGSATATAASLGSVVLPEMKRQGYNDALATACVAAGVAKGVPIMTIFRGVTPFWIAMIFAAILLVAFPQIATWLVSYM